MRFFLVFLTLMLFTICSFSQVKILNNPQRSVTKNAPPSYTGEEILNDAKGNESNFMLQKSALEVFIGETRYDFQTNGSINNRLTRTADGELYGVWTMGFQEGSSFPDRGTGFNTFDGDDWGDVPSERLEESVRTGWPNYVRTESGAEVIINHVFTNGEYRLHYLRRDNDSMEWEEGDLPSNTPTGSLWPTVVGGGENGESIHVLAITTPVSLQGEIYNGVESHPLYYRSQDAGLTWDIVDGVIPGLDSTAISRIFRADGYNIDANGDVIAIGIFDLFNDVMLFKSLDNGTTWTKTIAYDFPLDKYITDQGYDTDTIPYDEDVYPAFGSLFTADASGAVIIDEKDDCHLFYGRMFVTDLNTTDGLFNFFPGTSGINYWKEGNATDQLVTIADIEDINGNDTIDISGTISDYGVAGLTSQISAGIDEGGNIYYAYAALMEGDEYVDVQDGQHYRHIYISSTNDHGETWTRPYDIINENVLGDSQLTLFAEAVYPHLARRVDNQIHLIYQQDLRPGTAVVGDMDPYFNNAIMYVGVDIEDLVSSNQNLNEELELTLLPNPASTDIQIIINSELYSNSILSIYNSSGQMMKSILLDPLTRNMEFSVEEFSSGIYYIQFNNGRQVNCQKFVKM